MTRKAAIPLGLALGGRQRWSQPVLTAPIRKRDKRPSGARVLSAADGTSAERAAARGRGRLRLMRISGPGAHRVCKLEGGVPQANPCQSPTRGQTAGGALLQAAPTFTWLSTLLSTSFPASTPGLNFGACAEGKDRRPRVPTAVAPQP